jgi:DNA-binding Lrp family transcriptional regulator
MTTRVPAAEFERRLTAVRERIARPEQRGVVRGYTLDVDYERAGFQLHTRIICTAPIPERETLAEAALGVSGVVNVREVMTGAENLHVTAVGVDGDDLSRIGRELDDLGVEVVDEDLLRGEHHHPYHGFALDNLSLVE